MGRDQARQLPLVFQLDNAATLQNFVPGSRDNQVLHFLRTQVIQSTEPLCFLWGSPETGKTHLLQALCHEIASAGGAPIYVPLSRLEELAPAMLEGLEELDLVCIDDVDKITGQAEWEQALFNLYNRARDGDLRLVLAAASPPAKLTLGLPDLKSRLQSAVVFHLHELTDSERSQLLKERAGRLGIQLPDAVVSYVLQRHSRSPGALMSLLQELDSQSLALKRRITVPLVREIMGW